MTAPLFMRRRVATRPRNVLVSVTNHWQVTPKGEPNRREVLVRTPAGELRPAFLPDTHPALVSYLDRVAA